MYGWVDHTSEVELEISAATEAEVFADATRAVGELLGASPDGSDRRRFTAAADDRAVLLAEWIGELVLCAEDEGFVPSCALEVDVRDDAVDAVVAGEHGDPPHLVKAVTYHRLAFERAPGGWQARVVLDV